MNVREDEPAPFHLAFACLMIAAGGLLLGLQIDGNGAWVGTGWAPLGVGVLVTLVATLLAGARGRALPRDAIGGFAAACGFLGTAFVVGGVLAPGGGWMFFEALLLALLLARGADPARASGLSLRVGTVLVLALFLLFRLWITWQGSEHRWQVMSVEIPILSSLPFGLSEAVGRVDLGRFRPEELGFPPAGLRFTPTLALWAGGFALCVTGLLWRAHAALEHENDRIHATIHELPPPLAALVDKLLPEEDWSALGLHGLSDRMRRKKIEQLVGDRLRRRRELEAAFQTVDLLGMTNPGGFTGDVVRTLLLEAPDAKERKR
jgi:hypothetical protein